MTQGFRSLSSLVAGIALSTLALAEAGPATAPPESVADEAELTSPLPLGVDALRRGAPDLVSTHRELALSWPPPIRPSSDPDRGRQLIEAWGDRYSKRASADSDPLADPDYVAGRTLNRGEREDQERRIRRSLEKAVADMAWDTARELGLESSRMGRGVERLQERATLRVETSVGDRDEEDPKAVRLKWKLEPNVVHSIPTMQTKLRLSRGTLRGEIAFEPIGGDLRMGIDLKRRRPFGLQMDAVYNTHSSNVELVLRLLR